MAISSATIAALNDFTWAQIKIMAKTAIGSALLGGSTLRAQDGREIARVSLDDAKKIYDWASTMEEIESTDETGGTAVARFGQPQ